MRVVPPVDVGIAVPALVVWLFLCKDSVPPEIYTLSLHDALPIFTTLGSFLGLALIGVSLAPIFPSLIATTPERLGEDRKSTRLNSSHLGISYAVFCLKKKTPCSPRPTQ